MTIKKTTSLTGKYSNNLGTLGKIYTQQLHTIKHIALHSQKYS